MKRLGIDIGGTFTDAALLDEETGEVVIHKTLTTREDLTEGALRAARETLQLSRSAAGEISFLGHGTTVVTNAVLEHKGAKTALITTEGFRDILEVRRLVRPLRQLYALKIKMSEPLVPRDLRLEVPERVNAQGEVLRPLEKEAVRRVLLRLREEGVSSIAVCLLFSYIYPHHERMIADLVREVMPQAFLSVSSEILPEFGEYERTSTAVLDAYVKPIMAGYLEKMEGALREMGIITGHLYVMQSNGGLRNVESTLKMPVSVLESGPAAGVLSACDLGERIGFRNLITFDMGGTTAKAGLVKDGQPDFTAISEVGGGMNLGRFLSGSGFPVKVAAIDLAEVGAGGGSMAWLDEGGALKVGPKSAGADPGPACYGKGGTAPTVTDADLILGYLDPSYFGGGLPLFPERALQVMEDLGRKLGLTAVETAGGIFEIVNEIMAGAVRVVSVMRGHDPRDFALIAFGGAGPVHAWAVAEKLGIPWVIVPRSPGVLSALGLITADRKLYYVQSLIVETSRAVPEEMERIFAGHEKQGREELIRAGISAADIEAVRSLDMKYSGQDWTIHVPVPGKAFTSHILEEALSDFHQAHRRQYGFMSEKEKVIAVNLRTIVVGRTKRPKLTRRPNQGDSPRAAFRGRRKVFFGAGPDYHDFQIYDRSQLGPGNLITGPAVIPQMDATVVIPPGKFARVDPYENLIIGDRPWEREGRS